MAEVEMAKVRSECFAIFNRVIQLKDQIIREAESATAVLSVPLPKPHRSESQKALASGGAFLDEEITSQRASLVEIRSTATKKGLAPTQTDSDINPFLFQHYYEASKIVLEQMRLANQENDRLRGVMESLERESLEIAAEDKHTQAFYRKTAQLAKQIDHFVQLQEFESLPETFGQVEQNIAELPQPETHRYTISLLHKLVHAKVCKYYAASRAQEKATTKANIALRRELSEAKEAVLDYKSRTDALARAGETTQAQLQTLLDRIDAFRDTENLPPYARELLDNFSLEDHASMAHLFQFARDQAERRSPKTPLTPRQKRALLKVQSCDNTSWDVPSQQHSYSRGQPSTEFASQDLSIVRPTLELGCVPQSSFSHQRPSSKLHGNQQQAHPAENVDTNQRSSGLSLVKISPEMITIPATKLQAARSVYAARMAAIRSRGQKTAPKTQHTPQTPRVQVAVPLQKIRPHYERFIRRAAQTTRVEMGRKWMLLIFAERLVAEDPWRIRAYMRRRMVQVRFLANVERERAKADFEHAAARCQDFGQADKGRRIPQEIQDRLSQCAGIIVAAALEEDARRLHIYRTVYRYVTGQQAELNGI